MRASAMLLCNSALSAAIAEAVPLAGQQVWSAATQQHRAFAAKAKGGSAKTSAAPPASAPVIKLAKPDNPMLRLKWRISTRPNQLKIIQPELLETAKQLLPTPSASDPDAPPPSLTGLSQVGVPLGRREVLQLMHDSLGGVAGQPVQLRPHVFTNIFQSAPVVAGYVANALEAGTAWNRIERFFLSCVEADPAVAALKLEVNGRMGRKATMASTKIWEQGELRLQDISEPIDYGAAVALTRLGTTGVKVWIRYHREAAAAVQSSKELRLNAPLSQVLMAQRLPLPARVAGSSSWWARSGPQQPASHRSWEVFTPEFDPVTQMQSVGAWFRQQSPRVFTSAKERQKFLRSRPRRPAGAGTGGAAVSAVFGSGGLAGA
ncbi:hypothetical protein V8C86DRAFT_2873285 [Haematococcus lacustris]